MCPEPQWNLSRDSGVQAERIKYLTNKNIEITRKGVTLNTQRKPNILDQPYLFNTNRVEQLQLNYAHPEEKNINMELQMLKYARNIHGLKS